MNQTDPTHLTDESIVRLICQEHKRELLEILYQRYEKKIYYKCFSIMRNEEIAKDFTHDIFIKILSRLEQFQGKSNFSLWVHSISYNYCIDQIKKEKKKKTEYVDSYEHHEVTDQDSSEIEILHNIQMKHLRKGMEKLKPSERMLLLMYYQDNFSIEMMSTSLRIGKSAVKMRLKRTRDKLASLVKPMIDYELER